MCPECHVGNRTPTLTSQAQHRTVSVLPETTVACGETGTGPAMTPFGKEFYRALAGISHAAVNTQ